MKKICFLSGDMSRTGGTERVTAMIANELSKKPHYKIHVLSVTNEQMSSFFELETTVYHDAVLRQSTVNLKRDYFKVVSGIRQYIKKHEIDILIEVDVICNLYTIPATRFTKTRIISWEHFNYYSNNGSKLRDLSRQLTKYFSDHIVTLTEQDRQNYGEKLGISDKVTCIYNPIQSVETQSYSVESKQILSVGRLTYQKGFDLLCEVAKDVLPKHPDWTWVIIGEGEDRAMLEQKIKEYHLENRLILKGNQKEMEPYYRNSSLYVMTSRYEGLPMTLLEAKSYQLPIISFDCQTGPSEIVQDEVNGYLIEENNCEQMILKLNTLLEQPDQLQLFSQHAKNNIHKFELNEVIKKWEERIDQL